MNAPLDLKMDKATFLRWARHQEGRYELVEGRPVMQHSPTRRHGDIAKAIERLLESKLDLTTWVIRRGDLSVEIGEEFRLPDVMVEPAGLDDTSHATSEPVLIVEVMSPSSLYNDLNTKPPLYFKLATLETYIVASQDAPYLWVWQRARDAERAFPTLPEEIHDLAQSIELVHLGIALPVADFYRGIFSKPPET